MTRLLSRTFRSLKPRHSPIANPIPKSSKSSPSSSCNKRSQSNHSYCVYLILSTNVPLKTYVGVTTNFSRRLKQHNGELRGGAKASRSGRPWACACIIQGFKNRSEACEFESKWKSNSRKMSRKRKADETSEQLDSQSLLLLKHRQAALNRTVNGSVDRSQLEINWQFNLS